MIVLTETLHLHFNQRPIHIGLKTHEIGWDLEFVKSCNEHRVSDEQLRSIHGLRTHDG